MFGDFVLCALFVNAWIGLVLCLVAELVALSPNSKLQKTFKNNNKSLDLMPLSRNEKGMKLTEAEDRQHFKT